MYLHAIANSKNRLANGEYCWIKPGSIFCIHRIRSSRDDNSTVDLRNGVSKKSLTANFYTRSMSTLPCTAEGDNTDSEIFFIFLVQCSRFRLYHRPYCPTQLIFTVLYYNILET